MWTALVGSMTCVGGLLFVLGGGGAIGSRGIALAPLASTTAPTTFEAVFRTRSELNEGRWGAIVIHHSSTPVGSAADLAERHTSMGLRGLGFHFVVGNGSGMGDGEVHVGHRWLDQLPGAHVAGPEGEGWNRRSIGICMVGDGNRRPFTDQQVRRLTQLVGALCDRLDIPTDQVYLHSDLAEVSSPGRFFPQMAFDEQLAALAGP